MTNVVNDLLKRAYKDMDPSTGEFPADWCCIRCGVTLNADGGHPAEIYAGTYNGLCYPCTSAGPFVVSVAVLDGAQEVSWPPHCPSWRRDRETFYGYTDCDHCKGAGAVRGYGYHTPVWNRCDACSHRYHDHPDRKRVWDRDTLLRKVADARFRRMIDAAALASLGVKRASRKRIDAAALELPEDVVTAIRTPILEKWAMLKVRNDIARKAIYASTPPPPPAPKQHQLIWTPSRSEDGRGKPEVITEGTLDECRTAWTAFMTDKRMFETDPDRYPAIGKLRTDGALNTLHLIGSGSIMLLGPDRKDDIRWP